MNKYFAASLSPRNSKNPNDILYDAVISKDIKAVTRSLKNGANIDFCTSEGMTPLMIAINQRATNIAKLLIENGADINAKSIGLFTPLIYAAVQGFPDIVQMLIKLGADVSVRGGPPSHLTAYDYAKKFGHNEIVKKMEQAI